MPSLKFCGEWSVLPLSRRCPSPPACCPPLFAPLPHPISLRSHFLFVIKNIGFSSFTRHVYLSDRLRLAEDRGGPNRDQADVSQQQPPLPKSPLLSITSSSANCCIIGLGADPSPLVRQQLQDPPLPMSELPVRRERRRGTRDGALRVQE